MGAPLSKTRTLLEFAHVEGDDESAHPIFVASDDDPGETSVRRTEVRMDREVWQDMGEPHEITVTIEPGDLLNVAEPAAEPDA